MKVLPVRDAVFDYRSPSAVFDRILMVGFYSWFAYVPLSQLFPTFVHDYGLYVFVAVMSLVAVPGVLALVEYVYFAQQRRRHRADLEAFSAQHNYVFSTVPLWTTSTFSRMALVRVPKLAARFENCIETGTWRYGEFSYAAYNMGPRGDAYRDRTVCYGVMATKLPRQLPNVFFDSKRARGRQFQYHFDASQLHSLEGDFDKYFATYFPVDYPIDALSFITPEVMWALKEAADYDIEISANQLFLYAPIYNDENRLEDMAAKLLEIKDKLMHNIVTYRDERVPNMAGRYVVAPEGKRLKRIVSKWGIVILVFWILYYVYMWTLR